MMEDVAKNAKVVKGHSQQANLLGAGQFEVALSQHSDSIDEMEGERKPVTWRDPNVEPVPVRVQLSDGCRL